MIDRRSAAMRHCAGAGGGSPCRFSGAGSGGALRVASVKFGSLSWVLETIRAEGLDKKAGLELEIIDVASNQAGPVALLSERRRHHRQRLDLGHAPALARRAAQVRALFVGARRARRAARQSTIATLADLKGKSLGVAGSAIDKSWLLLRAYTRRTLGPRHRRIWPRPRSAPRRSLTEEIRAGRIDAVLNFWTYAARLTGSGFARCSPSAT